MSGCYVDGTTSSSTAAQVWHLPTGTKVHAPMGNHLHMHHTIWFNLTEPLSTWLRFTLNIWLGTQNRHSWLL